jgi:Uma2 family endonuclease
MALAEPLTIEDFEKLPYALALNHELVDGELVDVSGNTLEHNYLRDLIVKLLGPFVEAHNLGKLVSEQEYDFDGNAHGPDVSFVGAGRVGQFDRKRRVQQFVPDLTIEIVSPNDRFETLLKKVQRYRSCGAKEAWIFSIEMRQAYVYSEQRTAILDENEQFSSDLIPGYSIRIGDLLHRIDTL